jgi:hypothetical protein
MPASTRRRASAVASPLLTRTGVDATLTIRRSDPLVAAACAPEQLVTRVVDANGTATNVTTAVPRSCPVDLLATSDTGAVFTLTSVAGSRVLQDGTAVTGTVPQAATLYFVLGAPQSGTTLAVEMSARMAASHVSQMLIPRFWKIIL